MIYGIRNSLQKSKTGPSLLLELCPIDRVVIFQSRVDSGEADRVICQMRMNIFSLLCVYLLIWAESHLVIAFFQGYKSFEMKWIEFLTVS